MRDSRAMKKIDGERPVADAWFCIHNGKREESER